MCKVKGCNNEIVVAKGYCRKHYDQVRVHGKVQKMTKFDFNKIVDKGKYYELVLTDQNMKEVARAKIDKDDLKLVKTIRRWHLNKKGYVANGGSTVYMHRLIMGVEESHIEVDHKKTGFKYKRDNRKKNLRICTTSQNGYNKTVYKSNTSGHKGVDWHKGKQKWRVRVNIAGKTVSGGYFDALEDAVIARDKLAKRLHKEFYNKG